MSISSCALYSTRIFVQTQREQHCICKKISIDDGFNIQRRFAVHLIKIKFHARK